MQNRTSIGLKVKLLYISITVTPTKKQQKDQPSKLDKANWQLNWH